MTKKTSTITDLILPNALPIRHISAAVTSAKDFIDKRRKGQIKSLKTSKKKLNDALLDGLDW